FTFSQKHLYRSVTKSNILCSSTSCYLIQDLIGEGSFGKVTKGVNLITSQDVALKILKTEDTVEREMIQEWLCRSSVCMLTLTMYSIAHVILVCDTQGTRSHPGPPHHRGHRHVGSWLCAWIFVPWQTPVRRLRVPVCK
uniref:Protein kinase domain-containing protein n=1 Tax=Lates calcarifer TaxID=8187 RepID=A0A4W6DBZ0_LATCA